MSSFPPQFLSEAAAKLADKMADVSSSASSGPVSDVVNDTKKNLGTLFSAQLNKLNLVSREEFDIQAALLAKAQAKLAELEAKVAELEGSATTIKK